MRVLALDLSMTSTGVALVDTDQPAATWQHSTIKTGGRKKGERDVVYDLRRYDTFRATLVGVLQSFKPELVAVEVTSHSHGFAGGRRTTKGGEYRAGLFLGIAKGWLHGALAIAKAYGLDIPDVELLESSEVKRRITGNGAASKEAVRDFLEEQLQCHLTTWTPDEVDALAVAQTAIRMSDLSRARTSAPPCTTEASPGSRPRSDSTSHPSATGTRASTRAPTSARQPGGRSSWRPRPVRQPPRPGIASSPTRRKPPRSGASGAG
jgi:Holliday junction resolvasome RuvABC endonuclease subunit